MGLLVNFYITSNEVPNVEIIGEGFSSKFYIIEFEHRCYSIDSKQLAEAIFNPPLLAAPLFVADK